MVVLFAVVLATWALSLLVMLVLARRAPEFDTGPRSKRDTSVTR